MLPHEWSIRWPDGSTTEARTSYELLAYLGKQQPEPMNHQEMKDHLSTRAQFWSGKFIHPHQPDPAFLRELARVGLLEILTEGDF